jgi:circadian clock protein KaiC
VVGAPGSGKTTFVFQVAFHAAASGRPVAYVSTLSEPASRLLKHVRTFAFWDERAIGERLFLECLYPVVKAGIGALSQALVETVRSHAARLLIVDGFMMIRELHPRAVELRAFVNEGVGHDRTRASRAADDR